MLLSSFSERFKKVFWFRSGFIFQKKKKQARNNECVNILIRFKVFFKPRALVITLQIMGIITCI